MLYLPLFQYITVLPLEPQLYHIPTRGGEIKLQKTDFKCNLGQKGQNIRVVNVFRNGRDFFEMLSFLCHWSGPDWDTGHCGTTSP